MPTFDARPLSDEVLDSFDEMMTECVAKIERFSPLAVSIWSDVLRELDRRGRVRLVSGSYDDLGNALVQRLR